MKSFVVVCVVVLATQAVKLPPNFKTCNRKDPNFKTCLLEAARFAVKQFNRPYKQLKMSSLDPLVLPKIVATVETPIINTTVVLTSCRFSGLLDTKIDNFEIDFEKKTIDLAANWPELKSECDHLALRGQILRFPVSGEGTTSAIFKNFKWSFNATYEEVKRSGKTYVKPITTDFDGKPEYLSMNLDDLIGDDEELTKQANKLINDNWSGLYDEARSFYLPEAKKFWLRFMSGWFSKLSLEEAFDN